MDIIEKYLLNESWKDLEKMLDLKKVKCCKNCMYSYTDKKIINRGQEMICTHPINHEKFLLYRYVDPYLFVYYDNICKNYDTK